jgi:hypothetical protein
MVHFIELAGAMFIVVTTYFPGQDTPDVPKNRKQLFLERLPA